MIVLITFFHDLSMDSMEMDLDLDEVSQKTAASEPSLAVCWRWAEATLRWTMQRALAAQRWWSCCSRPMHRWMCKKISAGGLSSDTTRLASISA